MEQEQEYSIAMRDKVTKAITAEIKDCCRCSSNHAGLLFRKFRRPVTCGDTTLTHWGKCPVTQEPILLQVIGE
jgi:hypothetical protein